MKQVQPCSDCLATHGSWLTYGNGSSKIIVDGWILVRNKKTKLNQRGVRMVKLAHKFPIHWEGSRLRILTRIPIKYFLQLCSEKTGSLSSARHGQTRAHFRFFSSGRWLNYRQRSPDNNWKYFSFIPPLHCSLLSCWKVGSQLCQFSLFHLPTMWPQCWSDLVKMSPSETCSYRSS